MTRTPSPQTTEGLGATPLTAEERVQAVLDEWGYDDVVRSPTFIARILDAARLSVPSEATVMLRDVAARFHGGEEHGRDLRRGPSGVGPLDSCDHPVCVRVREALR